MLASSVALSMTLRSALELGLLEIFVGASAEGLTPKEVAAKLPVSCVVEDPEGGGRAWCGPGAAGRALLPAAASSWWPWAASPSASPSGKSSPRSAPNGLSSTRGRRRRSAGGSWRSRTSAAADGRRACGDAAGDSMGFVNTYGGPEGHHSPRRWRCTCTRSCRRSSTADSRCTRTHYTCTRNISSSTTVRSWAPWTSSLARLFSLLHGGNNAPLLDHSSSMGSETETVTVEGIPFPAEITVGSNPLSFIANGITDIEIHFLQIKYNAIGIYLHNTSDGALLDHHLQSWKGKTADELLGDDAFFQALVSAPVEKLFRVVVIKEIKGSQYGVQLESSVRDRLVAADCYDDDEEETLDKVTEFFQAKYLKPGSVITFHFPATPGPAEISFATEGKGEAKMSVENGNVAGMIQKWYLGGDSAVSPTTVRSLADRFATLLSA